jgi:hypothetical protein
VNDENSKPMENDPHFKTWRSALMVVSFEGPLEIKKAGSVPTLPLDLRNPDPISIVVVFPIIILIFFLLVIPIFFLLMMTCFLFFPLMMTS